MIHHVQVLNEEDVRRCCNRFKEIKHLCIKASDKETIKTFGAATYIHFGKEHTSSYTKKWKEHMTTVAEDETLKVDENEYVNVKNFYNKILVENFNWVYDKIIQSIYDVYGEESEISEKSNMAFPSFHIFPAFEGCENVWHPPHIDAIQHYHVDNLKNIYKNVNENDFLTITLSIKNPKNGAGLYYWDVPKNKKYSVADAKIYFKEIIYLTNKIKLVDDDDADHGFWDIYSHKDYFESVTKPKVIDYKEGYMILFKDPMLHQIMPFNVPYTLDEERITIQGHGIMCDGKWQLYF
jgi:hypothetical protein